VVAQEGRGHRSAEPATAGEQPDLFLLHLTLAGKAAVPEVRAEFQQGLGIQHRSGKRVVSDRVAFLDQADGEPLQLLRPRPGIVGLDQVQKPP